MNGSLWKGLADRGAWARRAMPLAAAPSSGLETWLAPCPSLANIYLPAHPLHQLLLQALASVPDRTCHHILGCLCYSARQSVLPRTLYINCCFGLLSPCLTPGIASLADVSLPVLRCRLPAGVPVIHQFTCCLIHAVVLVTNHWQLSHRHVTWDVHW
jgi:hypothetical protein